MRNPVASCQVYHENLSSYPSKLPTNLRSHPLIAIAIAMEALISSPGSLLLLRSTTSCTAIRDLHPPLPRQKIWRPCFYARNVPPSKGRGRSSRKASAEGLRRIMKGNDRDMEGWTQVATSEEVQEGKNKAIIYNDKGFVLVKEGNSLYAIEANCSSCKFPIIEGKVTEQESGELYISCPLCHSKFDLSDGRVVEYCPKDGPLQWVIGTLKEKGKAEAMKVFPARISNSGRVYVRFAQVQVL